MSSNSENLLNNFYLTNENEKEDHPPKRNNLFRVVQMRTCKQKQLKTLIVVRLVYRFCVVKYALNRSCLNKLCNNLWLLNNIHNNK